MNMKYQDVRKIRFLENVEVVVVEDQATFLATRGDDWIVKGINDHSLTICLIMGSEEHYTTLQNTDLEAMEQEGAIHLYR